MTKLILGITRWTLWMVVIAFVLGGWAWGYSMGLPIALNLEIELADGQLFGSIVGIVVGLFTGATISGYGLLQFSINDHLAAIRKEGLRLVANEAKQEPTPVAAEAA